MRGFKAFNEKLQCNGFQFEIGKTFEHQGEVVPCQSGFHFCQKLPNVYGYYPRSGDTRICEVEAVGEVKVDGDKAVTNKLVIIRELTTKEMLVAILNGNNSGYRNSGYGNSGDWNSGSRNSGDWNSGYGNSGYWNSGSRNSGDWNSGDWNSGYGNSGSRNSGDWNSGSRNSGDWNSGDGNSGYGNSGSRNSGDWNSGDGNSGYFNTKETPLFFFNKPSKKKFTEALQDRMRALNVKPILTLVWSSDMTDEEKKDHPYHTTTGCFLRKSGRYNWSHLTDDDKAFIKKLPNFSDKVFKEMTGVSIKDGKK